MLCNLCAGIEIAKYFQNEVDLHRDGNYFVGPSENAVCLGSLTEIYDRRDICCFCRLVISSLCTRWWRIQWCSPEELLEKSYEDGFGKRCYIYSYVCASNDGNPLGIEAPQIRPQPSSKAYRIGIGLRSPQDRIVSFLDHAGDIQLSGTSAAKMGQPDLFHGRVMDSSRVNVSLAGSWLNLCEVQHGQKCEVPAFNLEDASPDATPDDLLVLDVHQMCLYHMPQGKRYVALSYCWPENMAGNFLTNQSALIDLFQPGSLAKQMKKLSSVIQDAINFVYELGEQYLWIDALCIVQDDDTQKNIQIRQMDRVYGAAVLTIICASPNPPDEIHDGLPGYRSGSRICTQTVEEIEGLTLTTTFMNLEVAVLYSRWNQRAWTFQEHRISRRKLFFTELQLYFQCSCAVFCEDAVGEGCLPTAFIYLQTSLFNTCGIDAPQFYKQYTPSMWLSRSPPSNAIASLELYIKLFNEYSGRDMSYPGDIVFAFQGILSILKRILNTKFWAGLPETYLDESLLWLEIGQHTRRTILEGDSTRIPYPSWSWAGWATEATYEYIFLGFIRPEIDWFIIDDHSGVAVKIDATGTYDPSVHPRLNPSNKDVRPGEPSYQLVRSIIPQEQLLTSDGTWNDSHKLTCWTSIASFKLTGESFDLKGLGGTALYSYENVIIFDKAGNSAGSILLEKRWKTEMLKSRSTFEFMLLSRSNTLTVLTFFDSAVFPDREWCYINVMLIQRIGDIASRVGIGVIHEDAWVEAKPNPSWIKLE